MVWSLVRFLVVVLSMVLSVVVEVVMVVVVVVECRSSGCRTSSESTCC